MEPVTGTVPLEKFPGKTLDGFLVEAPLGRGGMAAVFRGRDISLNRPAAIKVLLSQAVRDPATRARFVSEARTAASLTHPNIVQTYRAGEQAGVLFIAMQYVNGQTLEKTLKRDGRLAPKRALAIAREVCLALEAAHAAGLVHRDIKPANIMVGPDGHVTVMDFGVAKPLQGEVMDGETFAGTPEYASPEQHAAGAVDGRSDLYSLGVTLYQMLTGRLPFVAETETTLRRRIEEEEPLAVRDLERSVPRPVAALVSRLMARSPAGRPATAREAIRAIDAARRLAILRFPAAAAAAVLMLAAGAFAAQKIRDWKPADPDAARPSTIQGSARPAPAVEPEPPRPPVPAIPWTDRPTVLVALFAGPDGESDWLPEAIADLIARDLAATRQVVVLPRSRVCQELALPENRGAFAENAARTHGAEIVVMGDYALAGDRLRLSVEILRLTPEGPTRQPLSAHGLRREFSEVVGPLTKAILRRIEEPAGGKSGS
ncbi:MAG: serine/threonine protein kinase [Planctomycetes bacterium]|nr:serine/threonine protein kinase [Planctomycetota bacterium]